MRLHVAAPLLGHGVVVGPAPWFKLVKKTLRMGPAEGAVGHLENHQWKIHGRFFTAFHVDEASTVRFETEMSGESMDQGPFEDVMVADGTLYADLRPIARYVEDLDRWRTNDGMTWPIVVVVAVGG